MNTLDCGKLYFGKPDSSGKVDKWHELREPIVMCDLSCEQSKEEQRIWDNVCNSTITLTRKIRSKEWQKMFKVIRPKRLPRKLKKELRYFFFIKGKVSRMRWLDYSANYRQIKERRKSASYNF